jgi:3-dehydroquinate synthase
LVENCCRIKKEIVEVDERERGLRRILNFGHTIGHALEAESSYAISHGNAVALGMIAMARISERTYDFPRDDRERIEGLLGEVGLPRRIPANIDAGRILARLRVDKKKKGGAVHFVLLKKMGMPFVSEGIAEELLIETLEGLKT